MKSHTKPKIWQYLMVPKDELPLTGAAWGSGVGAGREGRGRAPSSVVTFSLAPFTFMILAARLSPVDISVHLWTCPKRPLWMPRKRWETSSAQLSTETSPTTILIMSKNSPVQSERSRVASSMELLFLSAYEGLVLSFQPVVQCLH